MKPAVRAIFANFGWLLAGRGAQAVLSIVYLAIVTRTLGLLHFGRFALITGASQALTVFVGFQTWQLIVQYGTGLTGRGDEGRLKRLIRGCLILDGGSALLGVVLAAVILHFWHDALGIGDTLTRATLIFTCAQLLSIRSTALGILRMRDRYSLATIADSVVPLVRLVGAVLVALFHPFIQGFLAVWGAAEVLTAVTYWVMVARLGDFRGLSDVEGGFRRLVADHPGIIRFALSTNANSTLGLSSKQFPLLITGATIGTASAGAFRLAIQLAQGLTKLSQMLARAAFPEVVRAVNAGGIDRLGRLILRSALVSGTIAVVAYIVIALLGRPVLSVMGKGFGSAYPLILWLAAAGCIDLLTVGFEPALMAAHRAGRIFLARVAATGLMFVLAFTLGPRFGAIGIAAAVTANSLAVAVLLAFALIGLLRSARR